MKGTVNHARTSFSTEIFAGAVVSVGQYLAPLRYCSNVQGSCLWNAQHRLDTKGADNPRTLLAQSRKIPFISYLEVQSFKLMNDFNATPTQFW
jgi:hypothetical protein